GAAGRAHATLAGEWQVDTGAQRRIEDRLTVGNGHLFPFAVDDQRRERLGRRARLDDLFRTRLAAEAGDEALDMDAILGNADVTASRLQLIAHAGRAADEDMIDA